MATKALTYVGQRASHDLVPARQAGRHRRGWRELLISEDAEEIWRRLYTLVSSTFSDRHADYDQITQDFFIRLLTTERFDSYIAQKYSDEEIREDLLSLLQI